MHQRGAVPARRTEAERGFVFLYAVIGMLLVVGIVMAGTERTEAVKEIAAVEFDAGGHARQAAESGLVDALSWLRRQYEQPVTEFAPKRDMSVDPPVNETDDASVGLVREYEISRGFWGRYVVEKGRPAEGYVDSNHNGYYDRGEPLIDADGDGRRTMAHGCQDVSVDRGAFKGGIVWYLESEGSVYRRLDADVPLGQGRNVRLAHVVLGTEVRRLSFVLPASAALVGGNADTISVKGTVFESPILGIAYRPNVKSPTYTTLMGKTERCEFDSPIEHAQVDGWDTGIKDYYDIVPADVFGISVQTLRSMADYNVKSIAGIPRDSLPVAPPAGQLPVTIPEDALVVITPKGGKLVLDDVETLVGRGVVVVEGDLEVKSNTTTTFSGILYVTGSFKADRAGAFEGIVVVGKQIDVTGTLPAYKIKVSGRKMKSYKPFRSHKSKKSTKSVKIKPADSVWFGHNPDLVSDLMNRIGNYRQWKSAFQPVLVGADGRPDETFRPR
jgi:hypothetical protein